MSWLPIYLCIGVLGFFLVSGMFHYKRLMVTRYSLLTASSWFPLVMQSKRPFPAKVLSQTRKKGCTKLGAQTYPLI